ncbi:hypothetical protein EVAR_66747_1 [Eumeta japonica]|uniref:Uncharacterized protein n=1 Tax=Eumeta variegata TaxID=151549 RepID=A0A4C1Z3L0_EUMVA|nr:hypothetical protein EVAR_66747_1 [Eumeta japonica]
MSRAVDAFACRPAAFDEAIIDFQLYSIRQPVIPNFRGTFLVGFSATLPACTGTRIGQSFRRLTLDVSLLADLIVNMIASANVYSSRYCVGMHHYCQLAPPAAVVR